MNTVNISKAAEILGYTVKTLQRLDRERKLVALRTPTNRRLYTLEQLRDFRGLTAPTAVRSTVAYCRVSSQAQRPDLKNQRKALEQFCAARGLSDVEYIEEIGGGLNFKRKQFIALVDRITMGLVSTVVLAHKDRLVRFGYPLLEHICRTHSCELLVLNNETLAPEQEMVQDLMTIVHCFSSRLYGLRNYKKALKTALAAK